MSYSQPHPLPMRRAASRLTAWAPARPFASRVRLLALATLLCGAASAVRADRDKTSASHTISLAQALKKTVLVFPFDMPATATIPNGPDVQLLLDEVVESRLSVSGQWSVIEFNKNLPPVARLHLDQDLTDADVSPPFAESTAKALKITRAVGYDAALIGSVDEYNYSDTDNQVTMVVRGELIDAKSGKAIGAPVTLSTASSKGGAAKEPGKALEAARTGGSQLAQQLIPIANTPIQAPVQPEHPAPTAPTKKKHDNRGLLLGILAIALGVGIGIASSGGGHHAGAGGTDTPPSPP